jgi:putative ABC transport system permease protein
MCTAVILTTGRTVGAEREVLNTIDSAGTRSIIVRADPAAMLDNTVLTRIARIDGIEWAGAFGAATDMQNTALVDGTRVPVRSIWTESISTLGVPNAVPIAGRTAFASANALEQLGMADGAGGAATPEGWDVAIAGEFTVPDFLTFLEPLVIAPQPIDFPGAVAVLVVVVERPDLVEAISQTVQLLLAVDDLSAVTVTTSAQLAALRAVLEGQLGSFGRSLVTAIFAITGVLVAAILYGLVMMRRKDFGRRRALGASQGLIVALVLVQMAALSVVGTIIGSLLAVTMLTVTGDPLPGADFFIAVAILAVTIGVLAALVPATAAAKREPIRELRVP